MSTAALSVVAALWAQMRFVRFHVLVVSREESLYDWLRVTGTGQSSRTECLLRTASFVATLGGIAFPGAATLFASLITTLALSWSSLLPYEVDNSGTFGLLADANLGCGLAWAWMAGHDAAVGWDGAAPVLRTMFGTMYAFAALAKLNRDFADPRKSSVTVFALLVAEGFLPTAVTGHLLQRLGDAGFLALLHGSLVLLGAVEVAIPCLLAYGDPWISATVVWAFHLLLGTIAYDYSVLAMASLVVCAPPAQVENLAYLTTTPTARIAATILALVGCARIQAGRGRELRSPEHMGALLWLCALFPSFWLHENVTTPPGLLAVMMDGSVPPVHIPVPVPLIISGVLLLAATIANGLGPYLGYKTVATWAMFSNLHVEGGRTNHWLVPASWQIAGCCRDLVTVLDTDCDWIRNYHTYSSWDAVMTTTTTTMTCETETDGKRRGRARARALTPLQGFAQRTGCLMTSHANSILGRGGEVSVIFPYRVPYFQFRRMIAVEVLPTTPTTKTQDFYVDYVRGGRRHRFEVRGGVLTPHSDKRLACPPARILQKITSFKSVLVNDEDTGVCHGP